MKNLFEVETENFNNARVRILHLIVSISILKIGIILIATHLDGLQQIFNRALVALIVYVIIYALLAAKKISTSTASHFLILNGIVVIWMNIFISSQSVSTLTMQFVFMAILSGFYLLNKTWGIVYSALSIIPILIFSFMSHIGILHFNDGPETLLFPANIIILCLNFVTIIVAHYLFHEAFYENIHEKYLLNQQLKESVKEAQRLAQSKSDFLSTMSHELRTPLNMVIGMTGLLMDAPYNKEQKENLEVLNFSANSLHALINDILDFNKLESNKIELEKININLYELVSSVCAGLDHQAKEKNLQFDVEIDNAIKQKVLISDPTRITQMIYNIVGNGIKFTEAGHVKLVLSITNETATNMRVLFSVSDSGIGMNKEEQDIIFEPFTQASTSTTRNYGGTGLGLSIVSQLLQLFNSKMHVESVPGKGSVFSFEIDFEINPNTDALHQYTKENEGHLTGLRILAAEDNPLNTYLLKKLCLKWNINPVLVENGKKALTAMQTQVFDVVLMDIHMPEMDGYEASRRIREMSDSVKSKIPIIALSASVSDDLEEKIKEVGMSGYIRKPFHSEELFAKLSRVQQLKNK